LIWASPIILISEVVRLGSGSFVDDDESMEDILSELAVSERGVCPHCGGKLVSFKDKVGSGKRCPSCGWSVSSFG
jgi:uncharacterized protein (DUF983 family)